MAIRTTYIKDVVIQCLLAGKNVICEKPVALSSAGICRDGGRGAQERQAFTVHQNRRWDVDFLAMKQLYQSVARLARCLTLSRVSTARAGFRSDWRGEGIWRMLLDWGVHLIDQILQIYTQKITKLYCRFEHTTNFEVDDGFKLELTFENGGAGVSRLERTTLSRCPRFYMQAKDGSALITDWREKCRGTLQGVARER